MENTVVEKERFYHFDITRAFSIMLLPTIHIFEELELQEMLAENVVNNWRIPILYLCMFAPSLFMILFGAILNVLRFGLPAIIGVFTGQPMLFYSFLADLMQPDIYDFIGLFLLLFALMMKLRINEWWMLFISLTLLTINNWIPSFDTGSLLLNNFWGRFPGSLFYY